MKGFFHRFHSRWRTVKLHISQKQLILVIGIVTLLSLTATGSTFALLVTLGNIQSMAVYGPSLDQARTLGPDQISYNITTPSLIKTILQGIDFSQELDCSTIGSLHNAIVFIRFQDGNVARYQIVNRWSNFGAYGFSSCCFAVSPITQEILQESAQ